MNIHPTVQGHQDHIPPNAAVDRDAPIEVIPEPANYQHEQPHENIDEAEDKAADVPEPMEPIAQPDIAGHQPQDEEPREAHGIGEQVQPLEDVAEMNIEHELQQLQQQHRYNLRPIRSGWKDRKVYAFINISVKKGVQTIRVPAIVSMMKEMDQLHKKKAFHPVKLSNLDRRQ
jgi:hypothetical protein